MNREFANGPGDQGSISGWVIPNTQNFPPLLLSIVAIEKGAFGLSSIKIANLTFYLVVYLLVV